MKRKGFALLALVLLCCMLFSSCTAENIASPALFRVAGEKLSAWKQNATTLLSGGATNQTQAPTQPLAENGKFLYTVENDRSFSQNITAKIDALYATVTEHSGVDMRNAPAEGESLGKFKITLDSSLLGNAVKVTASNYFIGFANGNFYICAENELMLKAAIDRLTQEFITAESAQIGAGFWKVAEGAAITGETLPIIRNGNARYVILRSDTADENVIRIAMTLQKAIKKATGIDLSIETDFLEPRNAREIVIGDTKRIESATAKEGLDATSYRYASFGERLVITATNATMLEIAVNDFIDLFVSNALADVEKEASFALPAALNHTAKGNVTTLIENGACGYSLVYAEGLSSRCTGYITNFVNNFKSLTGQTLTVSTDIATPAAEGRKEFLIGVTNRHESETADLDRGEKSYEVQIINGQITVVFSNDRQLWNALSALLANLRAAYNAQNPSGEQSTASLFLPDDLLLP